MSLEFKYYKINDIGEVVSGGTPSTSKNEYWYGDIGWITPKDLSSYDDIYISRGERNISSEGLNNSSAKLVPKNTVLMTSRAPIGYIAIANNELSTNQGFKSLICNEKICHYKYFYYWLKLNIKYIINNSNGSTFKEISGGTFKNLELSLPSLNEQKAISSVLWTIDEKISVLKRINKNLEELAKAIYRHHFIDFKPYALGGLMKHSSQGMIPKDWSVQSIEEFVDDMKNGGTPKRGESDYWDNGTVPWLKTGEINNNIIIKSEEHITELGLKNSSAKLLPINSIIMALYGKGTAARIGLLKFEATTNQACCAMICNDFNKTLFLYLFLLFNQKEIENLASGSVQQNLSKDLIANLELVVPPIEIIDNLPFKEIFDTIANNYFEIEYLINLRDTLLPKLMSGEIDVSEVNCDLKIIIRKIYIKSSKLFLWRYLSENKNYIKNTKSNETLLKSRTIYKINKFLAKFNARYRYYRQ